MASSDQRYFMIPNFSKLNFGVIVNEAPVNALTLEDGLMAGIAILLGLISVFLGFRLFRITFLIAGIYFGYILSYVIMLEAGVKDEITLFAVSMSIGAALGVLMAVLWNAGLFIMGCVCGFIFSNYVIGMFLQATVVGHPPWSYVFTAGCCVAFGIAIFFLKKPILILATSALGSYFVFYGADVFAAGQTGFANTFEGALIHLFEGKASKPAMTEKTWGMVAGALGLTVVGILVQFFGTGKGVMVFDKNGFKKLKEDPKPKGSQDVINELEMRLTAAH